MTPLDKRLNAIRPDLADARLQGTVDADRFRDGEPRVITTAVADLKRAPKPDAGIDTQFIHGECVTLFDEADGYAWVQGEDGYVGYVEAGLLGAPGPEPTHVVTAPRSFVYPGPDLRFARREVLSLGSRVRIVGEAETRDTHYALLADGGALIEKHLAPLGAPANDYVTVAESLLNTPYLWGGASGFGIDCSGLVQLSLRMAGQTVLRDTDMQEASIGTVVPTGVHDLSALRRGDLVFWSGHVAIVSAADEITHAGGHVMMVTRESLSDAVERIGYLYGGPTSVRRP